MARWPKPAHKWQISKMQPAHVSSNSPLAEPARRSPGQGTNVRLTSGFRLAEQKVTNAHRRKLNGAVCTRGNCLTPSASPAPKWFETHAVLVPKLAHLVPIRALPAPIGSTGAPAS